MKLLVIAVLTFCTMCYVNGSRGISQLNQCQSNQLVVALHQAAFQLENGCLCNRTEIDEMKAKLQNIKLENGCSCNQTESNEIETKLQNAKETMSLVKEIISVNPELCYSGIKSGHVPDSAMTASSSWSNEYQAFYGRLDNTGNVRSLWAPARGQNNGAWIQVDFGQKIRIVGVVTQGDPRNIQQWVTSYKILYGDLPTNLQAIQDDDGQDVVFGGNRDTDSKVTNYFPQPITARYFRLLVVTDRIFSVIRLEYLIC